MRNFVFLGPPGAGKGTMAEMLCTTFGNIHISTGDILREEMRNGTELGGQVKACIERGDLVSDDIIGAIVAGRLAQADVQSHGCVLDGFPRTLPQAEMLGKAFEKLRMTLDAVVLIEAGRELLLKRLTARRICKSCGAVYNVLFSPPKKSGVCDQCGGDLYQRSDDTEETALGRLEVYERDTAPLIDYYRKRGGLHRLLCERDKHETFKEMRDVLKL